MSYFNKTEKMEFERAKLELKKFEEIDNLMQILFNVYKPMNAFYVSLTASIATSNHINFNDHTNRERVQQMEFLYTLYQDTLTEFKDYPEWTTKIEKDIGNLWNLIHSHYKSDKYLEKLYDTHGFKKYIYFK